MIYSKMLSLFSHVERQMFLLLTLKIMDLWPRDSELFNEREQINVVSDVMCIGE